MQRDLQVSRITATKYLDALVDGGLLTKQKSGRSNYYINHALNKILLQRGQGEHPTKTSWNRRLGHHAEVLQRSTCSPRVV